MVFATLFAVSFANPYAGSSGLSLEAPFRWSVPERAVDTISITLHIPSDHAVYRDQVEVKAVRGRLGEVVFPEAELKPDPYEPGAWRATYTADTVLQVPVVSTDGGEVELELTQQGCRKGLCWPIVVTRHVVRVVKTTKEKQ